MTVDEILMLVREPDIIGDDSDDHQYYYWRVDTNGRGIALNGVSLRHDGRVYFAYGLLASNHFEAFELFSDDEFRNRYRLGRFTRPPVPDAFEELKKMLVGNPTL